MTPPQNHYIHPHAFKVFSPLLWSLTRYDVLVLSRLRVFEGLFLILLSVLCIHSNLSSVLLPSPTTPRSPPLPPPSQFPQSLVLSLSPFSHIFYSSSLVSRNDWRKFPCTVRVHISPFVSSPPVCVTPFSLARCQTGTGMRLTPPVARCGWWPLTAVVTCSCPTVSSP